MATHDHATSNQDEVGTERINAFSDGVFAIAITLLVLTIHVPQPAELHGKSLLAVLGSQWANYLSYALSFTLVGQVWANHHTMFSYIKRSNHLLLVLNTLLLMDVAVLPFPTALLALYAGTSEQQTAVLIYSATLVVGGIFYNALWWYASRGYRLIDRQLDPQVVHKVTRRYLVGPLLYGVACALSFLWNGTVSLALCIFLTAFYLLPTVADRIRVAHSEEKS